MLALNGGLTAKEGEEPGELERNALFRLAQNNGRYQVRNKVTVMHPKVYDLVRSEFGELEVIASCLMQLDPDTGRGESIP